MVNRPSPTRARQGGSGKSSSAGGKSSRRHGDRRDGGKSLCKNDLSIMLCVLCASVVIPHAKPASGAGSGPEGAKQTQFAVGQMASNLFLERSLRGKWWVLTLGNQSQFRGANSGASPSLRLSVAVANHTTRPAPPAEIVTVALRRVDIDSPSDDTLREIDREKLLLLPNTSGARSADEAVRLSRLARAAIRPAEASRPLTGFLRD